MSDDLTREQVLTALSRFLVCDRESLSDTDASLRAQLEAQKQLTMNNIHNCVALQAQLEAQTERAELAQQTVAEQVAAYERLEQCTIAANQQVADLTAKMEAVTQERDEVRSELRAWKKHGHSKEQQLAASEQRVRELENKLIAAHASANARIEIHDQLLAEAQATIARLEQESKRFDNELSKAIEIDDAERDQLQATVEAQQAEIARLHKSIEKLLAFKKMWEKAYRDECEWHNQPEGLDRQTVERALASGKDTA